MYFILSKILLYLIFPLTWVFILLLIFLISKNKKRKRGCLIAAIVVLFIFSNPFLFNQFANRWDIPATRLNSSKYNCVIVLGGFSGESKIENGRFGPGADRFIQGVKLFETGKASHILITSGNGNLNAGAFREAAWAKTQLRALNIPDSVILIENASRNTVENARFSNIVLKKSHLPGPYLLVTSAFHMRRSLMIFKKNKMDVVPYPCNFLTSDKITFDGYFIPSAETLSGWNIYIKEVIGYLVNSINA